MKTFYLLACILFIFLTASCSQKGNEAAGVGGHDAGTDSGARGLDLPGNDTNRPIVKPH